MLKLWLILKFTHYANIRYEKCSTIAEQFYIFEISFFVFSWSQAKTLAPTLEWTDMNIFVHLYENGKFLNPKKIEGDMQTIKMEIN